MLNYLDRIPDRTLHIGLYICGAISAVLVTAIIYLEYAS